MIEDRLAGHVILGTFTSLMIMLLFIGISGLPWHTLAKPSFLMIWLVVAAFGTLLSFFIFEVGVI